MNTQMQLPAYIKQADPNAPTLARRGLINVGTGSPPYLSIEGGHFTLVDAAGNKKPMPTPIDVCIVDINDNISKCWFGVDYDPRNPSPPVCWSDNGIGPSKQAAEPQSATCAACPNNKWGSKISQLGSEVKECPDHQKVVLIVPGMPGMKFLLRIPGGSFKSWKQYLARFEGQPMDVPHVITQIAFDTSQGLSGMLLFRAANFLDDATAQDMLRLTNGNETDMMIGRTDVPIAMLAPPVQQTGFQQPTGASSVAESAATPGANAFGVAAEQGFATTASPSSQQPQGQAQQPAQRRRRGRPAAAAGPVAGTQAPFREATQPQATQPAQGQPFGAAPAQQPFQPAPGPAAQPAQSQPFGQQQPQANGAAPQNTFGFAQPNPPPNEMQASINKIFG